MLFKIFKPLKIILIKIYHFFIFFSWRLKQVHHRTEPINRYYYAFKKNKITYELKSRRIKNSSSIEIYKINNLYKPAHHYVFYSPRNSAFLSENWIYDISIRINNKRENINVDLKNASRINFKRPIFFIISTNVYSYFIFWNIFNILLLIKNKISFDIVFHENLKEVLGFNKSFIDFFRKYFDLKIIFLNPKKNFIVKSDILFISNYQKKEVYDINKPNANYLIYPKEIINDLPQLITNNKKLKNFFGKPRNDIVLISRSDSRIIKNEKDLLKTIPIIKKIEPEKLSIEEEIAFAYHAKVIIAPFGAAISNIFFARKECVLIRLTFNKTEKLDNKEDLFSDYTKFEMIAETKGMKYYVQNHGDFFGISNKKGSHFFVNINKLKRLLEKII